MTVVFQPEGNQAMRRWLRVMGGGAGERLVARAR